MKVFDPQIYPRKLFVIERPEELSFFHGRGGEKEELELDLTVRGRVWPCVDKTTKDLGIAVYFKEIWFDTIAHESTHIANIIFGDLNVAMNWDDDEHYSYLVGWIANCIAEAHDLKIIKKKKK